jgi:hypothetical protein
MPIVKEFTSKPKGSRNELETYKPKSVEDAILLEVGQDIARRYFKGKVYRTPEGEEIPLPLKVEDWAPRIPAWGDRPYEPCWIRELSDKIESWESTLSLLTFYELGPETYFVRVSKAKHGHIEAFHVKGKGREEIRERIESYLDLH